MGPILSSLEQCLAGFYSLSYPKKYFAKTQKTKIIIFECPIQCWNFDFHDGLASSCSFSSFMTVPPTMDVILLFFCLWVEPRKNLSKNCLLTVFYDLRSSKVSKEGIGTFWKFPLSSYPKRAHPISKVREREREREIVPESYIERDHGFFYKNTKSSHLMNSFIG